MWPEILYKFELIQPWQAVTQEWQAKHAEEELTKELTLGHPLYGRRVVALASGIGDDWLFFLPDGPALLALVHLTYNGPEVDTRWPGILLFASIDEWEQYAANERQAIYGDDD